MKRFIIVIFTVALGLGLAFGEVSSVYAQEEEFTLEEITVTAEKRAENLQDTSMAITVVQGTDLIEKSMESLHDILKEVPNLMTVETGMGAKIAIRGVGQDMPIGAGESPVATNFDGVYQMRWEAGVFGFFDIDRVEVLRGPQGMLYGRNATGGVVNVISAKPKPGVTEGYVALDVGNYNMLKGQAAINVPISDNFAARVALVTTKGDAYTKDIGGWRNTQWGLANRIQFRYQPSDEVSVNFLANYTKRSGSRFGAVTSANWNAGIYDINKNEYPWDRLDKRKYKNYKFTLNAEFPVGPGMVTFLPSFERIDMRSASIATDRATGEVTGVSEGGMFGFETTAAELRYASRSDARIQWVGGLYWTNTDAPGPPRTPPPPRLLWYKSYAGFGQITYPFSDTLRGIVGARLAKDDKGYTNYEWDPETRSYIFNYFDWKLGIEKDFTKDIMNYLTLSTGHRPGGFNSMGGVTLGEPFDMETLISAEWGIKGRFMDGRLQVNGDVYYYHYTDFQVNDVFFAFNPETGQMEVFLNFSNVDKVGNYGGEVEINTLLGNATVLDIALTFLHARYKSDFFRHENIFSPELTNLKGEPLPHAPEFTVKASIDHTFSLSGGSALKPRITMRWTDEQYAAPVTSPSNLVAAYTIVDVALTYDSIHNWTLNFYANNALDEKYAVGIGLAADSVDIFPGNPRTIGCSFNIRF